MTIIQDRWSLFGIQLAQEGLAWGTSLVLCHVNSDLCIVQITNTKQISAFHIFSFESYQKLKLLSTIAPMCFHRTAPPELWHLPLCTWNSQSYHLVLQYEKICNWPEHCWWILWDIATEAEYQMWPFFFFSSKIFRRFNFRSPLSAWLVLVGGWKLRVGGIQLYHIWFKLAFVAVTTF